MAKEEKDTLTRQDLQDLYAGTDYYQAAIDAAKSGDWASVGDNLQKREEKVKYTGEDYGKTSTQIAQELWGQYGNQKNALSGGFSNSPSYSGSKWDSKAERAYKDYADMSYRDFLQSNDYSAMQSEYQRAGRQSMQDTLGQISARTGGLASSYATGASQQQYNNYMYMLDKAAREMYASQRNDLRSVADLYRQLASEDYSRYKDSLSRFNNDRNYRYNAEKNLMGTAQQQVNEYISRGFMPPDSVIESSGYDRKYVKDMVENTFEQKVNTEISRRESVAYMEETEKLLSEGKIDEAFSKIFNIKESNWYKDLPEFKEWADRVYPWVLEAYQKFCLSMQS